MRIAIPCLSLLLTVGCATMHNAAPVGSYGTEATAAVVQEEDAAPAEEGSQRGIQHWIPNIFADLWDTLDADIGTGYGFGVHLKATNFLRLGIFDYSDFGLLGLEADTLRHGDWKCPWLPEGAEDDMDEVLDLSATLGVGLGANLTVHPWQIIDFLSTVVGFGYWTLVED